MEPAAAGAQPQPTQVTVQSSPVGQSALVAHWDCCGWQVHGPPQGSVPAQTVVSPGWHVGFVHPQIEIDVTGVGAPPQVH